MIAESSATPPYIMSALTAGVIARSFPLTDCCDHQDQPHQQPGHDEPRRERQIADELTEDQGPGANVGDVCYLVADQGTLAARQS